MAGEKKVLFPVLLALIGVLTGCTSTPSTRTPSTQLSPPTITIAQTSAVEPFESAQQTGVPVEYRLDIANPLDHAVTLVAVEIETVGSSGGYLMKRVRHSFAEIIPAHGTSSIAFRAWVQPLQLSDKGKVSTPVMLRGTARFESMGSTIKTAFAASLKAIGASR